MTHHVHTHERTRTLILLQSTFFKPRAFDVPSPLLYLPSLLLREGHRPLFRGFFISDFLSLCISAARADKALISTGSPILRFSGSWGCVNGRLYLLRLDNETEPYTIEVKEKIDLALGSLLGCLPGSREWYIKALL